MFTHKARNRKHLCKNVPIFCDCTRLSKRHAGISYAVVEILQVKKKELHKLPIRMHQKSRNILYQQNIIVKCANKLDFFARLECIINLPRKNLATSRTH